MRIMAGDGCVQIIVQSCDGSVQKMVCDNFLGEKFECCRSRSLRRTIRHLQELNGERLVLVYDYKDQKMRPDYEIEILKRTNPDLRIIFLSDHPSQADSDVIEQGVFYYMSRPVGSQLIEVIEAAVRNINHS